MKKRLFLLLASLTVIAAGGNYAAAQKPPTAKEAIREILSNGDIALSQFKGCSALAPEFKKMTLLDLIGEIVSEQTNAGSQTSTIYEVKPQKGKNRQTIWQYNLLFNINYPEENEAARDEKQTSLGIKFKIQNSNRKLIRNSVECVAAG